MTAGCCWKARCCRGWPPGSWTPIMDLCPGTRKPSMDIATCSARAGRIGSPTLTATQTARGQARSDCQASRCEAVRARLSVGESPPQREIDVLASAAAAACAAHDIASCGPAHHRRERRSHLRLRAIADRPLPRIAPHRHGSGDGPCGWRRDEARRFSAAFIPLLPGPIRSLSTSPPMPTIPGNCRGRRPSSWPVSAPRASCAARIS